MLVLRALFFALLMPGAVVIGIPWLLLRGQPSRDVRLDFPAVIGSALVIAGAATLFVCIRDFAVSGRGTLAPVDPPRKLVRVGLYRHVRNPMYLGVLLVLVGESLFFESPVLGFYAAVIALSFHLFVVLFEEPSLRGLFGPDYERYRASVPRWVPRLRPWEGRP
ncbi:MAG TPA: isoprenylcysteine carboxylmethyltransferase family protein [Thermoanaerobaculia bacterium]